MQQILLRQIHWDQIRAHLDECLPFEGCGLLAGSGELVTAVHRVPNAARSAQRFRMEAAEQVRAMLSIEASGSSLLGIYHSHPVGPPDLSVTDVKEARYPGIVHLVCFRERNSWNLRGYVIPNEGEPVSILVRVAG